MTKADEDPGEHSARASILSHRRGLAQVKRTFASLRNPVFRLYYGGMLGQRASMNMQLMARSMLVYRLTGSAAMLGVIALANGVPQLLFSLFGGVIADRIQKKYVILIGLTSSAVISLVIALALVLGYLSSERAGSWWILIAASVLQGTIMGLMIPSRQSIIREIVSQEQLMNAVSLDTLSMNIFRLLAPALTGFLIDAFDFEAVYFVMTALYLTGTLFIALMPRTGAITLRGSGALADIADGLRYIRRAPLILTMLIFTLCAVILSMPYMMLMPVFADDILGVGATGMGVLISVSGVGAIIGSLTLASLPNRRRGIMLLVGSVVLGLALVGFSFSNVWGLSLGLMGIVGLAQAVRMTLGNTLLQYYVDDEYRGRVMSVYIMNFGLTSFGTFAAGLLAEGIGVQWAVGGFAMTLAVLSILTVVFVPRLRRLD